MVFFRCSRIISYNSFFPLNKCLSKTALPKEGSKIFIKSYEKFNNILKNRKLPYSIHLRLALSKTKEVREPNLVRLQSSFLATCVQRDTFANYRPICMAVVILSLSIYPIF